ncbi:hypothetical protein ABKN59_011407 [Abortiporus biennis]
MGIVKSQPFKFPQQPHYLLLVVAALKAASLPKLGVSPFIDYSHPEASFGSYEHTFLQLPEAEDEDGKTVTNAAELRFPIDVQEHRRLLNTYGAIGRATTVVPILPPQPSATNTSSDSCEDMGEEYFVAKISWPEERRKSEDGYIRAIRKTMKEHPKAKHYVKNIVKVKYSLTLKRDAEELMFPRGWENFKESGAPRIFRLLVLVCYEPLQNVNSVEEFKKVFRDVVIAHHWVFTVAKILHRDLSATNLMVQRIGKEINGILADFDLAVGESKEAQDEEVEQLGGPDTDTTPPSQHPGLVASMQVDTVKEKAHTDKKCQKMRFRTGTGPFMAIDVLARTPTPIHIYRYDLESFFYVLVWFCAGFNPGKHTLSSIDDWRTPDFQNIAVNKRAFLTDIDTCNAILAPTDSTYKPLIDLWISPLRTIFKDVEFNTVSISHKASSIADLRQKVEKGRAKLSQLTWKEKKTLLDNKKNIEELTTEESRLKAQRDELCTYEKFMSILGGEPESTNGLPDDAEENIMDDDLDMLLKSCL